MEDKKPLVSRNAKVMAHNHQMKFEEVRAIAEDLGYRVEYSFDSKSWDLNMSLLELVMFSHHLEQLKDEN